MRHIGKARTWAMALFAAAAVAAATTPRADAGFELFLKSAVAFDPVRGSITLPLHRGMHEGSPVWYVITDSSDRTDAEARGVNFSPKLSNAAGTAAVQNAFVQDGAVEFPGTVDFAPA